MRSARGERLLDGIDPAVGDQIRTVAAQTEGVRAIGAVRARWQGHMIRAEIEAVVDDRLPVSEAHEIAERLVERLRSQVEFLGDAVVRLDATPAPVAGPHGPPLQGAG